MLAFASAALGFAVGWVLRGRMLEPRDLAAPPPAAEPRRALPASRAHDPQLLLAAIDAQERAAIELAIARGDKLEAIKRLRRTTGLGLGEAKEAVEALERGN